MCAGVNIESMNDRNPYHHGDLRNALIAAAAELAEQGGPPAVTIRAAARAVGVTPTAAYRHFKNHEELLGAANLWSLSQMADAMRLRLAVLPPAADEAHAAMDRMEAIGRGYVDFALSRPGLFRTAFLSADKPTLTGDGPDGPHVLLVQGIDELLRLGFVTQEFRVGLEVASWSLVHGLATLLIDGPLVQLPPHERDHVVDQTLALFSRSLWATRSQR
jgi:AcrR family transcriptional regulator